MMQVSEKCAEIEPVNDAPSSVVLKAQGIRKSFGGQRVLGGISLELQRGEVVLLRGHNGSGKTTLLNVLTGNLEPDAGSIHLSVNGAAEHFHFPRRWWQNLSPWDHFIPERVGREGVGRTWQEVRLFSTQSLRENIAVAKPNQKGENPFNTLFRRRAVDRDERTTQVNAIRVLERLGLQGREDSSADKVSLGQSKRVAIARAVQSGAKILFLDEPLSGLDSGGVADVMELLDELAHSNKITLVIVEHILNIPRVLKLADTVWTLYGGGIASRKANEVISEASHVGMGWYKHFGSHIGHTHSLVSKYPLPGGAALTKLPRHGAPSLEPVLQIDDLVVRRGNRLVIGREARDGCVVGLSMALCSGEVGLLEASNGWGKTTLLEAICGLIPVQKGTIRLHGVSIEKFPAWERTRMGISLLQARHHTFQGLTVRESLELAGISPTPDELQYLAKRRVSELSGGERQKLAIACVRTGRGHCFLMDEPFSALDDSGMITLCDIINKHPETTFLVAGATNLKEE